MSSWSQLALLALISFDWCQNLGPDTVEPAACSGRSSRGETVWQVLLVLGSFQSTQQKSRGSLFMACNSMQKGGVRTAAAQQLCWFLKQLKTSHESDVSPWLWPQWAELLQQFCAVMPPSIKEIQTNRPVFDLKWRLRLKMSLKSKITAPQEEEKSREESERSHAAIWQNVDAC